MNGIRVNRKKRLIYWQSIAKTFEIAYVPEKGNPLAGLVYDKFGLYAFGSGKRFSLRFDILTQGEKEPAHHYAGVYPTPNEQYNDHILLAVQAYLTEENPEFLQHIGKRFKVFGSYPAITFCNFAALPCCFSHKKAQIALDNALEKWHKKPKIKNKAGLIPCTAIKSGLINNLKIKNWTIKLKNRNDFNRTLDYDYLYSYFYLIPLKIYLF
ncbi:Uncharacterised protein [Rodentibacter pneumotropicus]|uniref:Uncharacterized protein n=1 Tax=Rodentibacter pneumotropicus TaxID=758 RepID=A0A3S4XV22_9PAST|nr:Uncharacterised protein [Rodentibacter pneumotropicus]